MRAARIENGIVADLWEVPSLTAFKDITLISAPDAVQMGWAHNGVNFIAPVVPPEVVRQAAIDTAIREFEAEAAAISEGYSQAEIDTFSTQEAEAKAWSFNDTAPTPLLDAIISESGVTKAEIVMTVLNKAAALKAAVGAAIGRKKKKQKAA